MPSLTNSPLKPHVSGIVNGHGVMVLIDGCNTHNFIQDHIMRFLNLCVTLTTPLSVMVGDDNELSCSSLCRVVLILIQTHNFEVDLYFMSIVIADLVFGC